MIFQKYPEITPATCGFGIPNFHTYSQSMEGFFRYVGRATLLVNKHRYLLDNIFILIGNTWK